LPGIDHESNKISYLVRSKGDYKDLPQFQDDGPFEILADPGEGNRGSRKLYFRATAYDGLGPNITELDLVQLDQTVDDETVNSDSAIKLSIDDQAIRGSDVNGGAKSEITYTVDIVDVISPLISIIDHEDPIEGILPEIYLLNRTSTQRQIQGNSDEQYYFPDPGLIIRDNYYTEEEITEHNNISVDKKYVFEYVYGTETKTYESVWEFPNRDLDISVVGSYEVFYSLNDPSGNLSKNYNEPDSDEVSRQVNVVDSRAPVVRLYGSSIMYVDLQSIIDGSTSYYDPGAYAIENLYVAGDGLFDWKTSDSKLKLSWDVSYSLCNDLENDTYDAPQRSEDGSDLIEATIQTYLDDYLDDPTSLPTEAVRFIVTYALQDGDGESANRGEANRTVELRGSPNLYPHIYFVLNHDENQKGDPLSSASTIDGTKAVLPTLVWPVEVGVDQFSSAPDAFVFNDLGGDVFEEVQYSTQLLFLDENNISLDQLPSYSFDLQKYLQKVNFWGHKTDNPNYVQFDESTGFYEKYPKGHPNWRRVVIRYKSAQNELGNYSVRDLEIRLRDKTPPSISVDSEFDESIPIKVGEAFEVPDVEIFDSSLSSVSLTPKITTKTGDDLGDDNSSVIFDELKSRGFWEMGEYKIKYNAEDEFGNTEDKELDIIVEDPVAPYVAVLTHDALRKYNSNINLNSSNLTYQNFSIDLVSPNDRFKKELPSNQDLSTTLDKLSDHYVNFSFDSESPYIKESNTSSFHLFSTQLGSDILQSLKENPETLVSSTSKEVVIQDDFGRTYMWYSPFELKFKNSNSQISSLQDPGFLIFEPSNSGVEITSNLHPQFYGDDQIKSLSVTITVSQSNNAGLQTTSNSREYIFLDDVKPLIMAKPNTDQNSSLIVVEAGRSFDANTTGFFRMMREGVVDPSGKGETVLLSAYDVADFPQIPGPIFSTVTNLTKPEINQILTGYGYVNDIYKIEYNVNDSQGNAAIPVERFIVVKDTIPPEISGPTDELILDYKNANNLDYVKEQLLVGVSAVDYGYKGSGDLITPSADISWQVNITKPISDNDDNKSFKWNPHLSSSEIGVIYPYERNDDGYNVTITATDASGNTSNDHNRTLKISDTQAPQITLIGEGVIHDFLRYSTNTGFDDNDSAPQNKELLFADQTSGESFDSSGYNGGAHRIILDNYRFVDPGAYAEDGNSYFSVNDEYPDLDGDGIGETYAIRRVTNRADMLDCEKTGVIYIYSALHDVSDPLLHYQTLMQNEQYGTNTNSTEAQSNNVKVPDVNGSNYKFEQENKNSGINLDVVKIINEYKVRDGWDNESNITERIIYIYESTQYPNFAFYATPLTDGDGQKFEHFYDDGTESRKFLNSTRKDTDGDGVSDFWELAFGSNPEDRNSVPEQDLSDPTVYNSIDFNTSSAQ